MNLVFVTILVVALVLQQSPFALSQTTTPPNVTRYCPFPITVDGEVDDWCCDRTLACRALAKNNPDCFVSALDENDAAITNDGNDVAGLYVINDLDNLYIRVDAHDTINIADYQSVKDLRICLDVDPPGGDFDDICQSPADFVIRFSDTSFGVIPSFNNAFYTLWRRGSSLEMSIPLSTLGIGEGLTVSIVAVYQSSIVEGVDRIPDVGSLDFLLECNAPPPLDFTGTVPVRTSAGTGLPATTTRPVEVTTQAEGVATGTTDQIGSTAAATTVEQVASTQRADTGATAAATTQPQGQTTQFVTQSTNADGSITTQADTATTTTVFVPPCNEFLISPEIDGLAFEWPNTGNCTPQQDGCALTASSARNHLIPAHKDFAGMYSIIVQNSGRLIVRVDTFAPMNILLNELYLWVCLSFERTAEGGLTGELVEQGCNMVVDYMLVFHFEAGGQLQGLIKDCAQIGGNCRHPNPFSGSFISTVQVAAQGSVLEFALSVATLTGFQLNQSPLTLAAFITDGDGFADDRVPASGEGAAATTSTPFYCDQSQLDFILTPISCIEGIAGAATFNYPPTTESPESLDPEPSQDFTDMTISQSGSVVTIDLSTMEAVSFGGMESHSFVRVCIYAPALLDNGIQGSNNVRGCTNHANLDETVPQIDGSWLVHFAVDVSRSEMDGSVLNATLLEFTSPDDEGTVVALLSPTVVDNTISLSIDLTSIVNSATTPQLFFRAVFDNQNVKRDSVIPPNDFTVVAPNAPQSGFLPILLACFGPR